MLLYVFMYTLTGCHAFNMVAAISSTTAMTAVKGRITCSIVSRFYGINAIGLLLREETACWVFGLVRSKLG